MPTPEESKRIFRQLFGRDPKGTEKIDPSVAYQDSLAVSKERIARGEPAPVDSARVFMGRKPEKPDKELTPAQRQKAKADSLRDYLSIMKSQEEIARAKTAGTYLKPDKLGKTEGVIHTMSRLSDEISKQDKTIDEITERELESEAAGEDLTYPTDEKMMEVAETIKAAKMDTLGMAESLHAHGYTETNYMIGLLSKIEPAFDEFLRMRQDPAVDSDPAVRHTKAMGKLMQETGLSIEDIQDIMDATGKSKTLELWPSK